MSNYDGKYFELGIDGLVIHIKETNNQTCSAVGLVEIDDWAGQLSKVFPTYWHLNSKNIIAEISYPQMMTFVEITKKQFLDKVKEELGRTIQEFKSGNSWAQTHFKQTDARMNILRSHYGTKP